MNHFQKSKKNKSSHWNKKSRSVKMKHNYGVGIGCTDSTKWLERIRENKVQGARWKISIVYRCLSERALDISVGKENRRPMKITSIDLHGNGNEEE